MVGSLGWYSSGRGPPIPGGRRSCVQLSSVPMLGFLNRCWRVSGRIGSWEGHG